MSIIGLVLGIIQHGIIGTSKSIMCVSLIPNEVDLLALEIEDRGTN